MRHVTSPPALGCDDGDTGGGARAPRGWNRSGVGPGRYCPDQARSEAWILSGGWWQHDERAAECYDDGDWIYLGDGVWEDAYLASLPADTRRDLMDKYRCARRDS